MQLTGSAGQVAPGLLCMLRMASWHVFGLRSVFGQVHTHAAHRKCVYNALAMHA